MHDDEGIAGPGEWRIPVSPQKQWGMYEYRDSGMATWDGERPCWCSVG